MQEKTRLAESAKKLIQEANDRAKRLETLTELTGPLSREKRAIMLEMLEDVKNNNLKEAFNRYLPTVLNNGNAPSVASKQRELVENAQRNVAITGNRATLAETVQPTETAQNSEIGQILYLAGITNKEVIEK